MTILAAEEVRQFGVTPKVALLSYSNFGSHHLSSAQRMQEALQLITERAPDLEVEGEMHADAALIEAIRNRRFPDSCLTGSANLLVMPNLDAANIDFNLLKAAVEDCVTLGPILIGAARSVHVVTPSITVRGLLNMTAIAVAKAQREIVPEESSEEEKSEVVAKAS